VANVLYLAHRIPYPPDKGDKLRSYHVLRALSAAHRVTLGTFVDDDRDLVHLPALERSCAALFAQRLPSAWARLRAITGLLSGQPLSLAYYRSRRMDDWVKALRDQRSIDAVVVSSSQMAPYAQGLDLPILMDFIDVDSLKWRAYAQRCSGLQRWIFNREATRLLAFERSVARRAHRSYFVTPREVELFRQLAPEAGTRAAVLENGVDTAYFSVAPDRSSPYDPGEIPILFTGTMSYRPNVDAMLWFARDVLPGLRARWPAVRLSVVGRDPAAEVRRMAGSAVRVTGTVADTRPWLQHAAVVVAPMRIARGVQNKVLEGLAMGRPVVAAEACVKALDVQVGEHLLQARDAPEYLDGIAALLADPVRARTMGAQAREHMRQRYAWPQRIAPLVEAVGQACAR